jgi:D-lactate dehydrogenase
MTIKGGGMKVLVYSSRPYDREFMEAASKGKHEFHFTEARLEKRTAKMAGDFPAVCCFVSDSIDSSVLQLL